MEKSLIEHSLAARAFKLQVSTFHPIYLILGIQNLEKRVAASFLTEQSLEC